MDILQHYFKLDCSRGKIAKTGKYYNVISRSVCAYIVIKTDTAVINYFFDEHGKVKNRHVEEKGV